MSKAENVIPTQDRAEQIALRLTADAVPSQAGLMDNETARALIHQGILDGIREMVGDADGRWEHTILHEYGPTQQGGRDVPGYRSQSGRYRQAARARSERDWNVRRVANATHGNPRTYKATILRRPVFEGAWQEA